MSKAKPKTKAKTYKAWACFDGRKLVAILLPNQGMGEYIHCRVEPVTVTRTKKEVRRG